MAPRKRKTTRSVTTTGKKLIPTLKKQGLLKGSGMYAAKQTGIAAMKKVVPAYMLVVGLSAATPPLGAAISRSVSTIPVVGELTNTAVSYGAMLRSRLGRQMPDFSLGFGSLYGRFVKDEKQPERRSTGGGQSGSQAFSDRSPTPKNFFGPLTGLGEAAVSTGMSVFGKFTEGGRQISGDVQDISGKTQEAIGKTFTAVTGAPGAVVGGVTAPVGQLSKDVLPLAAIAAAVLLLRK